MKSFDALNIENLDDSYNSSVNSSSSILNLSHTLFSIPNKVIKSAHKIIFSKKNKPKKIYTAGSSSFYERITPKFISPSKRIPLTKQNYFAAFDTLGRVKDPVGLKNKIFEGSISEEIRDSVWEFLLGVHSWSSTFEERKEKTEKNRKNYFEMLNTAEKLEKDTKNEMTVLQIERDVMRNDRDHYFFSGEKNITKMKNILLTYLLVYMPNTPYVQGMSDFAAIMVFVAKGNEFQSFYLFERVMSFMAVFFCSEKDNAMALQISFLVQLIMEHDLELYNILEKTNTTNLIFSYRDDIICKCTEHNDVFEYMQSISNTINLDELLCKSDQLFRNYIKKMN